MSRSQRNHNALLDSQSRAQLSFHSLRLVKAHKKPIIMIAVVLLWVALLIPLLTALPAQSLIGSKNNTTSINNTADNNDLKTWWHDEGEINFKTAAQPGNVRQSHKYSIQVSSSLDVLNASYYDSFVYASIPRNGNGNILKAGGPVSATNVDGISIEADVNITMAWTQFVYSRDVWVKIHRLDGTKVGKENVIIRPVTLNYNMTDSNGDLFVRVPYSSQGTRFSVEFQDNLYTYRDSCATPVCDFVQNEVANGFSFVKNLTSENPVMGVEPRDALLIFASPFLEPDLVPDPEASTSLVIKPGFVTGLDKISASAIIFQPGVYYFGPTAHANLSASVDHVYIAAGAYVKGAIEFNTNVSQIYATGYGVLSGEQYVYQANTALGYINVKSDGTSLHMWSGTSYPSHGQTFNLKGITLNAPPFNSMDFRGDLESLSVQASDYKQVGAFFGQTDGIENYPGSHVRDIFYHTNDDTIKTYYSNVLIERVVVWKGTTAPTVQFGWASRNLTNITVNNVDIIHSRYNSNDSHPSLFGANQIYMLPENQTNTAQLQNTVSNITFSNFRSEGISGNLLRIVPLSNFRNFLIENVSIDVFSVRSNDIFESQFPEWTDEQGNPVRIEGFHIKNFFVNGTKVSTEADNWQAEKLGGLNVAKSLWDAGSIAID